MKAEFFAFGSGVDTETDVYAVGREFDETEARGPGVTFDVDVVSRFDDFEHRELAEGDGGVVDGVSFHGESPPEERRAEG